MQNYHDMTGDERWASLESAASQLFATDRWKTAFCRRYGLTPQTLTAWRQRGSTPVWACQAAADGLDGMKLAQLRDLLSDAL